MARSQEKAMSMLNRWVDQKRGVESGGLTPFKSARFPSECRSVREGEFARSQILRELGSSISQIQNANLGELRIRELNDLINRLLRSKFAWEQQIRQLGGPDYSRIGASISETDGVELPGQGGYKYFGAAKALPDVRELLQEEVSIRDDPRKDRKHLLKRIQPDYYGWRDEDDPSIIEEESIVQKAAQEQLEDSLRSHVSSLPPDNATNYERQLPSATYVYDTKELEQLILTKRKQLLLSKYIDSNTTDS